MGFDSWELESDCLLLQIAETTPQASPGAFVGPVKTKEDQFGIREPVLYFLNGGGGWPFSIGGFCRLGASGRLLRPDCRHYERSLTLLEHLPELSKQTGGQTIPTCNRELAIRGSVDSGNLFVGSGTPASLNAGSHTIEDVGMTPNFA